MSAMKIVFKREKIFIPLVFGLVCLFTSCSPVLKVEVAPNGDISYSVESAVAPVIEDTVRSFTGAGENLPLFNEAQILQALNAAGLEQVSVDAPSNSSLVVSAQIDRVVPQTMAIANLGSGLVCEDMVPQVAGAIGYCHSNQAGQRKLVLTISPEVLQQVLAIMPMETVEYLDLLSAPILTGETMSASEYIDLISVVYGDSVAKELKGAAIKILVTVPSPARSASVSDPSGMTRVKGKVVEFTLGLPELLSNPAPTEFTVQY